ncbi:Gfo/Idh/MocA family oxidoreductase [Candidatus Falkowbacteria bacterium]|nr:Gfo/Idh/MocA family oxidoreductase [Candidatus Falkowbacteria bacterium]
MDKLNFALIGCGRIASKHATAIENLESANLVAVCDPREERAAEYAKRFNIPWYRDYHDMLQNQKDIDVVNILTESGNHAKNAIDVAKYGKHLIVEKPMALSLDDADKMIKTCDENNSRLFVVKQNRYNIPIKKLREALEQGRFGKLIMGTIRVRWCRRQDYYDQDAWRGTWTMDGGVLANQASHHLDLLEWMMGDVESVYAKTMTALANIEVEDTGVAILKFTNGALGIVEATTATRPIDTEGSISILGEKGMVEVGGFALNEIKTWQFEDKRPEDDEILEKHKTNPPNVYGFGHIEYLKDAIECVKSGKKALVDGLEGRKSLELIHAIYESAETGKEVPLRFKSQKCRLGEKNNG